MSNITKMTNMKMCVWRAKGGDIHVISIPTLLTSTYDLLTWGQKFSKLLPCLPVDTTFRYVWVLVKCNNCRLILLDGCNKKMSVFSLNFFFFFIIRLNIKLTKFLGVVKILFTEPCMYIIYALRTIITGKPLANI